MSKRPVQVHSGTLYPCSPQQLASYRHIRGPNRQRRVHAEQATREIVLRNSENRRESDFEQTEWEAMERLSRGVEQSRATGWSPDIIIKMFADLDLVFFNGALLGNITLCWREMEPDLFGLTSSRPGNQADIMLNPLSILLRRGVYSNPFCQMFQTTLHEMCVRQNAFPLFPLLISSQSQFESLFH